MRKTIFSIIALLTFSAAQAQVTLEGSKLSDNWSIGINGVGVTPLTHHSFFKNMRGGVSLDINKQLTPIFGFTLEGSAYFNASEGAFYNQTHTKTVVDATNVSLLGRVNLMNFFGTYTGSPRCFELETVYGIGWLHTYGEVSNTLTSKAGLNFNFNLGESKAWTFSLKPAVVWDLVDRNIPSVRYNANYASFELAAGFTYRFKTSNGTHNFKIAEICDPNQIDALNQKINDLQNQLDAKNNDLNNANQRANQLENDLNDCKNRKPEVVEVKNTNAIPETVITFDQGKSIVKKSQLPNIERVATYLKNHENAKVSVLGYASPEGGAEINAKIATARANAVKDILVKKYKISSDRITAEGQGVGNMFSEPDWNRVSICDIK